ncbi:MAG: POTRA domain-containing protein [Kosmotogaceae bacterium]
MKRILLSVIFIFFSLAVLANKIVEIEVTGVERTIPQVVINISGLKIGEELDIERVYRAKRNLEECGLFTDVYLQLGDVGGDYKLVISVQESSSFYPYFGEYLTLGAGERNLLAYGENVYGGIRFLRFTDKKLLGFLPEPEFFWGGLRFGASTFSVFGTGINPFVEVTLFKEVPWQADTMLSLNSVDLGATYPFGEYIAGISYTYESASFEATPSNNYSVSILTGAFSFGDEDNYQEKRGNLFGKTTLSYGFGDGINYLQQKATVNYWYRIIGRIYIESETRAGVTYFGEAPVTRRFYLGGSTDLKGWNPHAFNPRFYALEILQAGVPLTESFAVAPSDDMSTFIPKLYLMGAAGDNATLGLSIGIGFEWRTPLGVGVEPQVFFGENGFTFYFELR